MENKLLIFTAVLISTLIFVAGCSSYQTPSKTTTPTETPPPGTDETDTSGTSQGEVKEFTIRESNFKLDPETITVNKGDTVRITVINDEGMHNLFIEDYNERTSTMSAGDNDVIEFIADKTGTFDMWCEVGNHRGQGMEGTLIVG